MKKDDVETKEDLYKVGDIVYRVCGDTVQKTEIVKVEHYPHPVYTDALGFVSFNHTVVNRYFPTEEEATAVIERAKKIKQKKILLKEYEAELNKKYGLENHNYVK